MVLELGLCGWLLWKGADGDDAFSLQIWPPLLFTALLFGICLHNVNSKVGAVCKSSIVENIREL